MKKNIGTGKISIALVSSCLRVGAVSAADKSHSHEDYSSVAKKHLEMSKTENGREKMKEAMSKMMAHQMILHDMTTNPETAKVVKSAMSDPEMKALMQEVKSEMSQPEKQAEMKREVLSENKEIMMVVAHAVMKNDESAKKLMGEKDMEKR